MYCITARNMHILYDCMLRRNTYVHTCANKFKDVYSKGLQILWQVEGKGSQILISKAKTSLLPIQILERNYFNEEPNP